MEIKDLKFVKGELQQGKPATICFFDEVDYWSVKDFVYEFNWIKEYVEPSEIKILINSIGGNCMEGINAFSTIINCDIPTTCIIEGIAASMGSIIWAAGRKCMMRDYALLMIHNPWMEDNDDPENKRVIENFKSQLKTIYMKRFCMDEEKVSAIMNGDDGYDGTFFTAQQAVDAGFITSDMVIDTPQTNIGVAAKLEGVKNINAIRSIMQGEIAKNLKLSQAHSIINKGQEIKSNTKGKNMNQEFLTVAALLGLTGEKAKEDLVSAKIQELIKAKKDFDTIKSEHKALTDKVSALSTELEGSKASVQNLTKNLQDAQDALEVYKTAEKNARTASINAMVESAIESGKISKENKETWVNMAEANYDLAKQTLDSIPARDDIAKSIASDPDNKKNTEKQMTDPEDEVKARVDAVVGKDFQFRKI